jgi:hypothetical protein
MPGMPDQAMQGLMGAAPQPMEEEMGGEAGGADQVIAQVIELLSSPMDPQTKAMLAQKIMEAIGGGGMGGGEMAEPGMEGMG